MYKRQFTGCIKELDKAFNWAEKYGLNILLDLHTAPLGQNGFDNGGICGVCRWSKSPEEVEFVLSVLERLAERYGNRKGLWGIEAINEPVMDRAWKLFDVPNRYPAADKDMAEGSGPCTLEFLKDFYVRAYDRMRKFLPEEKYVVIHDGFELLAWQDFMQEEKYVNVVLDTHQYLMMAEAEGCEQNVEAYQEYIRAVSYTHLELSDWGAVIIKFWVQIDKDTQLARFTERQNNPEKQWKITEEDWRNREKWDLYEDAVDEMLKTTSTFFAPWHILESVDKKYARIKALKIVIRELEKVLD